MSAPNQLTEEQILAEVQRTLDQNQQSQNKPRIKVGDQEFDPQNAQAIQDAINNALTANKSEYETLKSRVEQLSTNRATPPTDTTQTQQTQVQGTPPPKPRNLTDEEWSQEFVKAPQRMLDESVARMLGVGGSGGQALLNAFTALSTEVQTSRLENKALLAKAQELDQKITSGEARSEAQQFIDSHEDYDINQQNQQIMESYLTEYGLAPTARNLGLVYNQAKSDGKIQGKQTQTQQFTQQTQQPALRQGMPRLGGQSGNNMDENFMLERANKLPIEEHFSLIERLRNGTFQR